MAMGDKGESRGSKRLGCLVRTITLLALPLASSCSTDGLLSLGSNASGSRSSVDQGETSTPLSAGYPRFSDPDASPGMLSAEEKGCRRQLEKLGVAFEPLPPINDGGACHVDNPIKMSAIGSVEIRPAATLNCEMALTFARWTKKELVPSARWRYFSGVKTIRQGSSYSCRNIAGSRTSSEHARGNALDVMSIELNNGDTIDVRKPGFFAFWQRGFLNNVREDGCTYFSTVLGPGYNYDHRNHFHFDIKERRNGHRACH